MRASRRKRFGIGLLAAGGACVAAGCSLFTSLSGFNDGADDAAAPGDAAAAPGDAAAAPGDAAAAPGDAAAAPVDAGPFCARTDATFCEDFDDPAAASRWLISSVTLAAHGIDSAAFTSPPGSLFGRTNVLAAGEAAESYRRFNFPTRASALTYAFDLRLDKRGQRGLLVASAGLEDPSPGSGFTYAMAVVLGEDKDHVEESREGATKGYADYSMTTRVTVGTWVRVSVALLRQGDGTYRVLTKLDGVTVVDQPLVRWAGFTGGAPYISVGSLYTSGPSSSWELRMDNVTVDLR